MTNSNIKLDILIGDFMDIINDMQNKLKTGEYTSEDVDALCNMLQPQVDKIQNIYYSTL